MGNGYVEGAWRRENFPGDLEVSSFVEGKVSGVSYLDGMRERKGLCSCLAQERQTLNREVKIMTDPVCGRNIEETNPEFQARFAGKKYVFCSEECRKEFEERPEEYVETAA